MYGLRSIAEVIQKQLDSIPVHIHIALGWTEAQMNSKLMTDQTWSALLISVKLCVQSNIRKNSPFFIDLKPIQTNESSKQSLIGCCAKQDGAQTLECFAWGDNHCKCLWIHK